MRVWTESGRYINKVTGEPCEGDDMLALSLWTSHEPTDEDSLRRRRNTIVAARRRDRVKLTHQEG